MIRLAQYFQDMQAGGRDRYGAAIPETTHYGYMAQHHQECGSEDNLVAILDTGCNATCHGSEWLKQYLKATGAPEPPLQPCSGPGMKGIGGQMKLVGKREFEVSFEMKNGDFARGTLVSLEIASFDAPLLLSVESQKQLGFVIDLNHQNVHSTVLGSDLCLVARNGLLAIRLIPGYLGLVAEHFEDTENLEKEHNMTYEQEEPPPEEDIQLVNETHMAVDEMHQHKRVFPKGQKKQFKKDVQDVKERDQHMWGLLRSSHKSVRPRLMPRGCRTLLLEIFAGAAILSHMASEMGYPVSQPVDILYDGTDLRKKEHRDTIDQQIEKDDPYLISMSPLCGPWCQWQELNMSKSEETANKIMEQRKEWYPVVKWISQVIRSRVAKGRQVLLEQPWLSKMWDSLALLRVLQDHITDPMTGEIVEVIKCDQCAYGLKDRDNGMPNKKPTGLMTASLGIKENMSQLCPGDHQHQALEGSNRTKRAQEWPRPFCEGILQGILCDLEGTITKVAFPAEAVMEDNPLGTLDKIYDEQDLAPNPPLPHRAEEDDLRGEEDREGEPGTTEGDRVRKKQWLSLPYAQRVALRRLHQMTGHSSIGAMARMLRVARAAPEVINKVKYFKCEICQHHKKPQPRPVVRPPSPYTFNFEITSDAFEVRDGLGNRYTVLSIIDMGTLYHSAWIVSDKGGTPSSQKCAEIFRDHWFTHFGPPKYLTVDRGVANRGQVAALMSAQGVYIRYAGTEAHHQIGRAERQGSLLKEIIKNTVAARHIVGISGMRMAVMESTFVKNCRVNHAGFSPTQWVMGKLPDDVTSLTVEQAPNRLGVHEEMVTGETEFAQQLNIRQAAKEAFEYADSSRRIRTSLLRRSTPLRGPYVPGDLVCFFRVGRWYGPARVIGREGRSNLWLIHGGVPITINEESCRPALQGEVVAKQLLELRPSRKRKRQILQDHEDEVPFADDLMANQSDEENQDSYLDVGRPGGDHAGHQDHPAPGASEPGEEPEQGMSSAPAVATSTPPGDEHPEPPPGLPADPLTLEEAAAVLVPAEGPEEPPGLVPDDDQEVEFDEFQEAMNELGDLPRHSSVEEPDIEPDSKRTRATTEGSPTTTTTPTPLQRSMWRSLEGLDGHPTSSSSSRQRSRTPPRTFYATQNRRQKIQSTCLRGFLARRTNYKKKSAGSKEINYSKASPEMQAKLDQTRHKEWTNWTNFDACEVIPPQDADRFRKKHPRAQVAPMRWVDVNKADEGEEEQLKSRLVVRGDLENQAHQGGVRTDSPTASHLMLSMVLSFASCNGLRLHSGDITAAFLQGLGLSRMLIMSLPKDGVPGVAPGSLLVARKPVYGTKDAPRGFWKSLHNTMKEFGLRPIPHENAAYVMNKPDGSVDGLVISHVDDLLWCGGDLTQQAMDNVQKKLKFGRTADTTFKFCGRMISQDDEGIHVTCPHGLERTTPIALSTARKVNRGGEATHKEQSQMRSVLGSLNWIARVNRPDLAYDTSRLQSCVQKPCVQDLVDCNSLLRRAMLSKDQRLTYVWRPFKFEELKILSITDASHANDYDLSSTGQRLGFRSQSGRILAFCGPDFIDKSGGPIHILEWKSSVIRRVCRSTLQAESLSMLAGYEDGEHLRMILDGLHHGHDQGDPNWRMRAQDGTDLIKLTDCRSLSDHLTQQGLGEVNDKRLAIDLCGMRQMIWRRRHEEVGDPLFSDQPPQDGSTRVLWISTKTMLADALTKHMDASDVRAAMNGLSLKIELQGTKSDRGQKKDECENEGETRNMSRTDPDCSWT